MEIDEYAQKYKGRRVRITHDYDRHPYGGKLQAGKYGIIRERFYYSEFIRVDIDDGDWLLCKMNEMELAMNKDPLPLPG